MIVHRQRARLRKCRAENTKRMNQRWAQIGFCQWLVAVALCAAPGCARHVLKPHQLPPDLVAAPVIDVETIDLTQLTGYTVSTELIEPGDLLEVTLISGYSERGSASSPVRVADNGMANIPLLGNVALAGLELEGAEQAIAAAAIAREIYKHPHVIVVMEQKRVSKVTVIGAVKKPGVYELPRASCDLLGAIVAAGGLTDHAGTNVDVRSPGRIGPGARGDLMARSPHQQIAFEQQQRAESARSVRIDLVAASRSGHGGVPLRDGDVIKVEKRDPKPIHVLGLVNRPGQYELPSDKELRVLDAVALAGGTRTGVADKIYVIRRPAGGGDSKVIKISMNRAKHKGEDNLVLASGDTISVEHTPATVALDAIKNFVRIGFSASSRFTVF